MLPVRTHYSVLGVPADEAAHGIRARVRDLAQRFHPARVGPGGAQIFDEIDRANAVVGEPRVRRAYDDALARAEGAPEPLVPTRDVADAPPFALDAEGAHPSRAALLDRIRRNFTGAGVPKGETIETFTLTLAVDDRARALDAIDVAVPVFARCEACGGLGATPFVQCPACEGEGLVAATRTVRLPFPHQEDDADLGPASLAEHGVFNLVLCAHLHRA